MGKKYSDILSQVELSGEYSLSTTPCMLLLSPFGIVKVIGDYTTVLEFFEEQFQAALFSEILSIFDYTLPR